MKCPYCDKPMAKTSCSYDCIDCGVTIGGISGTLYRIELPNQIEGSWKKCPEGCLAIVRQDEVGKMVLYELRIQF